MYSYAEYAAVHPSATPVINCLNCLSVTSPAAKTLATFVSEVMWLIFISPDLFVSTPIVFANSESIIWPMATKTPLSSSSFEFLYFLCFSSFLFFQNLSARDEFLRRDILCKLFPHVHSVIKRLLPHYPNLRRRQLFFFCIKVRRIRHNSEHHDS